MGRSDRQQELAFRGGRPGPSACSPLSGLVFPMARERDACSRASVGWPLLIHCGSLGRERVRNLFEGASLCIDAEFRFHERSRQHQYCCEQIAGC